MKKHPLILCAGITSLLLSACNPVKVPEAMGDEMTGVVVNPFGVDLQLNIARPQNQN